MNKWGKKSLQVRDGLHENLKLLFDEVLKHFDCSLIEGHRRKYRQELLYDLGQSKINWPDSKHNKLPSQAVDALPYPVNWYDLPRLRFFAGFVLGVASQMKIKIRWGGDWDMDKEVLDNIFNDLCHFEILLEG